MSNTPKWPGMYKWCGCDEDDHEEPDDQDEEENED